MFNTHSRLELKQGQVIGPKEFVLNGHGSERLLFQRLIALNGHYSESIYSDRYKTDNMTS